MKLEYKWMVLINTTIGMLMASINQAIVLISLPAIFSGLHFDPLAPGQSNLLLWTESAARWWFASRCVSPC